MKITLCRKAHFNAAHKVYNKNWSQKENIKVQNNVANRPETGTVAKAAVAHYADYVGYEGVAAVVEELTKWGGGASAAGLFTVNGVLLGRSGVLE